MGNANYHDTCVITILPAIDWAAMSSILLRFISSVALGWIQFGWKRGALQFIHWVASWICLESMKNASDRCLKLIWSSRSCCSVTDWNVAWELMLNESRYFTSTQFENIIYSFRSFVGVVTASDTERKDEREEGWWKVLLSFFMVFLTPYELRKKTKRARDWILNNFGWLLKNHLIYIASAENGRSLCKYASTLMHTSAHLCTLGDSSTFECKWKASKVILRWPW